MSNILGRIGGAVWFGVLSDFLSDETSPTGTEKFLAAKSMAYQIVDVGIEREFSPKEVLAWAIVKIMASQKEKEKDGVRRNQVLAAAAAARQVVSEIKKILSGGK